MLVGSKTTCSPLRFYDIFHRSGLKNDRDNNKNDLQRLRDKLEDLEKALRRSVIIVILLSLINIKVHFHFRSIKKIMTEPIFKI